MKFLIATLAFITVIHSVKVQAFETNCSFLMEGTAYKKTQSFKSFLISKGGSKMSGHGKWKYNNVGNLTGFKLWSVQVMPHGTTEAQCRTGCTGGFASAVKTFIGKHSTCSAPIQRTDINEDYHLKVGSTSAKVSAPHDNGVTCTCERNVIANTVKESVHSFFGAVGNAGGSPTKKRKTSVYNGARSSGKDYSTGGSKFARNNSRRSGRQ
ncbi:MAG TPA: hypothetical protein VNJ01_06475 [Bacteriovoracaceae bacterium]|nr:hypothetical protein [Bacteriovoracaceae bacterium]